MNIRLHASKCSRSIVLLISLAGSFAACSPAISTPFPSATPNIATTAMPVPASKAISTAFYPGLASNPKAEAKVEMHFRISTFFLPKAARKADRMLANGKSVSATERP